MDEFALFLFSSFYNLQNQLYARWEHQSPSPFVQFGFNSLPNPNNYYNSYQFSLPEQIISNDKNSSKQQTKLGNVQKDSGNNGPFDENLKVQQNIEKTQKAKKHQNNHFLFYDPGQALFLTFGMKDIELIQKKHQIENDCKEMQKSDIEEQQKAKIQILQEQDIQKAYGFKITEPGPDSTPFLIIRAKTSKRRVLSLEEYQRRAQQIEKRRIKNLHRLEIEERIGKKLPTKNKKWQRKKQSLVFNANQYKKKLINSKKFRSKEVKLKQLFTASK